MSSCCPITATLERQVLRRVLLNRPVCRSLTNTHCDTLLADTVCWAKTWQSLRFKSTFFIAIYFHYLHDSISGWPTVSTRAGRWTLSVFPCGYGCSLEPQTHWLTAPRWDMLQEARMCATSSVAFVLPSSFARRGFPSARSCCQQMIPSVKRSGVTERSFFWKCTASAYGSYEWQTISSFNNSDTWERNGTPSQFSPGFPGCP